MLLHKKEKKASVGPCPCYMQERLVSEYHAVAGGIATPNSMEQHLIDATETHFRAVCISKN